MTCNCTCFIYNEELLHEIWREKSYDFLKWLQFPEETYTPCLIMIDAKATCEENTKAFAPISLKIASRNARLKSLEPTQH